MIKFQVLANGTWLNVCGEKWNKSHSDIACQSLGYISAITENFIKKDENQTKFYKLKPSGPNDASLLSSLEETESCETTVSLTCQAFSKCFVIIFLSISQSTVLCWLFYEQKKLDYKAKLLESN